MTFDIAVTGLNAADNPAPGTAVMRSFREEEGWSGRIVGLAYDAYEPAVFDRQLVDSVYLLPYPSEGREVLFSRLRALQEQEDIRVILPTLDSELPAFVDLAEDLRGLGIASFLPTEAQLKRRAKANLPRLAEELDVPVPESRIVSDFRGAERAAGELKFPLLVKGLFYDAYFARDASEMIGAMQRISARWGYPMILQRYLPGEEYNLAGLGDGEGGLVASVGMKKVFLTDKGKGWAGVSIVNRELREVAERFARTLKWRGGFELETLMSPDGKLHIIEVNPRFPAWIYLAKACKVNLPYGSALLALGREPSLPQTYEAGIMFVHYTTDLVAGMGQVESLLTRRELHYRTHGPAASRE